jgi:hypothetical protein
MKLSLSKIVDGILAGGTAYKILDVLNIVCNNLYMIQEY